MGALYAAVVSQETSDVGLPATFEVTTRGAMQRAQEAGLQGTDLLGTIATQLLAQSVSKVTIAVIA